MTELRRYPGAPPFEEKDADTFFGREQEIESLYASVHLNQMTVMEGVSGLGKSSLVNAGLIRKVYEEGKLHPFTFRFTSHQVAELREDETYLTPLEAVKEKVRQTVELTEKTERILPSDDSLWYLLQHQQDFVEDKGLLLIFDQFEELFTYPKEEREAFYAELAEVLYTNIPQRFRSSLEEAFDRGEHAEYIAELHQPLNVRALFCIRSDRMSYLTNLKSYFPAILSNVIKLEPLTQRGGRNAIVQPALIDGEYLSHTFRIEPDCLRKILSYLTKDGKERPESTTLQIICAHVEDIVSERQLETVTCDDIGEVHAIYENFCAQQLDKITDPADRYNVESLLMDGLILRNSEVRLSLHEGVIESDYCVGPALLEQLVDLRLLRVEAHRGGGRRYEISHDTMVAPILKLKEARDKRVAAQKEQQQIAEMERLRREREEEKRRSEELQRLNDKLVSEQRKAKRRLYAAYIFAALSILFMAFLGWSLSSVNQARDEALEAEQRERRSKLEQLTNFAVIYAERDPTISFRLAEAAIDSARAKEDTTKLLDAERVIRSSYNSSGTIKFYDRYRNDKYISTLSFHPPSERLAAGGESGEVMLINAGDTEADPYVFERTHSGRVTDVQLSDDGNLLASGCTNGEVILHTTDGSKATIYNFPGPINSLSFSADGRFLAIGAGTRVEIIPVVNGDLEVNNPRIYFPHRNVTSGTPLEVIEFRFVGADRAYSYSDGNDAIIYTFIPEDGQLIDPITIGSDRQQLVTAEVVDWEAEPILFLAYANGNIVGRRFSDLAWLFRRGGRPDNILTGDRGLRVTTATLAPATKLVVAGTASGQMVYYDTERRARPIWATGEWEGIESEINTVTASPDGRYFLTTAIDQTTLLWNRRGEILQRLEQHEDYDTPVLFIPDPLRLVTASREKIRNWQFKDKPTLELADGITRRAEVATFIDGGDYVVTGYIDGSVRVHDRTGKLVDSLPRRLDGRKVEEITFPGSQALPEYQNLIAIRLVDQVEVHNFNGGQFAGLVNVIRHPELEETPRFGYELADIEFTPFGVWLLTSGRDGQVYHHRVRKAEGVEPRHIFDSGYKTYPLRGFNFLNFRGTEDVFTVLPRGRVVYFMEEPSVDTLMPLETLMGEMVAPYKLDSLTGHQDLINSIDISSDQQMAVTASDDRSIIVYDISDNFIRQIRRFTGHKDRVLSAKFSNDGQYVVSAGADGLLKIWDMDAAAGEPSLLTLNGPRSAMMNAELSANLMSLLYADREGNVKLKPVELDIEAIRTLVREGAYGQVHRLNLKEREKYFGKISTPR